MVANILTIDLEEWFHLLEVSDSSDVRSWDGFETRVCEATAKLLDLFAKYDVKATFFCLGWIAEKYPKLLKDIVAAGHDVGCHSYYHSLVHQQDWDSFVKETRSAKLLLESICGVEVVAYRAPGFSITEKTPWAFQALLDLGFEVDSSMFVASHAHGGWTGAPIDRPFKITSGSKELLELPVLPAKVCGVTIPFSGGGYFRLLPYLILKHFIRARSYNMTYFHPRDFDQNQPRALSLGPYRHFRSYVGIKNASSKLEALLMDFKFISVSQFRATDLVGLRNVSLEDLHG